MDEEYVADWFRRFGCVAALDSSSTLVLAPVYVRTLQSFVVV